MSTETIATLEKELQNTRAEYGTSHGMSTEQYNKRSDTKCSSIPNVFTNTYTVDKQLAEQKEAAAANASRLQTEMATERETHNGLQSVNVISCSMININLFPQDDILEYCLYSYMLIN